MPGLLYRLATSTVISGMACFLRRGHASPCMPRAYRESFSEGLQIRSRVVLSTHSIRPRRYYTVLLPTSKVLFIDIGGVDFKRTPAYDRVAPRTTAVLHLTCGCSTAIASRITITLRCAGRGRFPVDSRRVVCDFWLPKSLATPPVTATACARCSASQDHARRAHRYPGMRLRS
ncbi:hypothetical protein BV20DRAFT_277285 [Pilatotrama ljubarskyi]|nr:hypothetical protein BV20DRAFT_277285 [Pilatotrama ljubarskyi]